MMLDAILASQFSILDGGIVGIYLVVCIGAGVLVRKYVGKVEHFLVAGREMNVFLGIASLAATEFGIVTCMYTAQNGFDKGFAGAFPGIMLAVAMLVVGITGICIRPLRNAGVITIPELFEKRFGSKIRWLSGVVIVLGGLLNMGVFLRTGGDFLIHVCGMPETISLLGMQVDCLKFIMTVLLLGVATYTILGGMVSVLITDYLQFIVMSFGLIAVTILILIKVGWSDMVGAIESQRGAGGFNPIFHKDMGWDYVIFNTVGAFAIVLTWQTMIQRVLAAKDSRIGQRIYRGTSFFFVCRFLLPGIWGIAALATLAPEQVGDNTLLAMPKFLGQFVPIGLMGLLIAAMLAADMSTDAAYMLSWGSVIYNDILAPVHKNKWSHKRGLRWNRVIVGGIGVFLLVYGLWYELKGDLWTYLLITGTIYLSSMSVLLVACCYWRRANNWGAAAAIVVGAALPIVSLVLEQKGIKVNIGGYEFSNDVWGILTYGAAAAAMVIGSLLKPQTKPVQ